MKELRELVIELLDDEHGLSEANFNRLKTYADARFYPGGLDAVWDAVEAVDGRFYIGEDAARELRKTEA